MAKSFSAGDVKKLQEQFTDAQRKLHAVLQSQQDCIHTVGSSVASMQRQEALKLINDIPIEELNRNKKGIRTKLLRENGFDSLDDLYGISTQRLASIKGIGDESAKTIKKEIEAILRDVGKQGGIKLSLDDKSADMDRLLQALYRYRQGEATYNTCGQLDQEYGKTVADSLPLLKAGTGSLSWLFAGKEKKAKTQQAYDTLRSIEKEGFLSTLTAARKNLDKLRFLTVAQARKDFQQEPIAYVNLLEKLCPGMVQQSGQQYGLPAELAQAIAQEPVLTEGLQCTLRPYQLWGVKYILHQQRVLLGDEMGLGKTVQAIATMVSLRNSGEHHFVVVCPLAVLSNWYREIQKFSDLTVYRLHGSKLEAQKQGWLENGGVAVTTFEAADELQLSNKYRFGLLVVDEAHYIKNPQARRSKEVTRLCENAKRLLFMSGTALENRVEEMNRLMGILQPDVAKELSGLSFLASAPVYREKIAPVYYRRKREDVLKELPEKTEKLEWCTLGKEEEAVYARSVMDSQFAKARRVSWSIENMEQSCKAQRMLELIDDAQEEGRKVLVFSFFLDTIGKICSLLGEKCMPPITGAVKAEDRQAILDAFEKAPAGSVLVAQIQSGGTGLNIQSASVVILCEPQFKPSIENQAISRVYRMGQTRNVLVHRLLCEDTVDERILALLEEKQKLFDAFADESAVADETMQIDQGAFSKIMEEERARLTQKQAQDSTSEAQQETTATK